MVTGESFQVHAIKLVTRIIRKMTAFKKYLLLRKFPKYLLLLKNQPFGRGTCFEKVHILNNYFFQRKSSLKTAYFIKWTRTRTFKKSRPRTFRKSGPYTKIYCISFKDPILTNLRVLISNMTIHQIFFISNSFISNCTRFYKIIKQLQYCQIFGNSTDEQMIAFLSMNKKIIACTNL